MIERIKRVLDEEETKLFMALKVIVEESDRAIVSEAARRIGLTPQKGWDVFRRIQRKAQKFGRWEERELMVAGMLSEIPIGYDREPRIGMQSLPFPGGGFKDRYDTYIASLGVRAGFEMFYDSLPEGSRQALSGVRI